MSTPFVHLHVHSEYSLLDGLCPLERGKDHTSPFMQQVKDLGMEAIALTDHGNLFGAIHFHDAALKYGIHPVFGCEVYVTPLSHTEKTLYRGRQANHLVLLAENDVGWRNLMRLNSEAHLHGMYYKPRIDRPLLRKYHEGLIALSACLKGEVAESVSDGDLARAEALAAEYADIMGPDNFFIEIQDHGLEEQQKVNPHLITIADKLGLPLVVTNDVHYLRKDQAESHEMLLCLQTQDKWANPDRMKYGSKEFYIKSGDEMAALFPERPDAVENTVRIAERCNVSIPIDKKKVSHFPVYQCPGGISHEEYIVQLATEGAKKKYGVDSLGEPPPGETPQPSDSPATTEIAVRERFWYEISIIRRTGFLNYYLVVWDFIHAAKSMGIPVGPGRGSGAGSIVAFLIGITNIDPLRYALVFERFLNPERVSAPDFDVDFCQARRGEVIEYVRGKYGIDAVSQIVTYGTLGAKTLIRDIGRALDYKPAECDKIAKLIPDAPGTSLASARRDSSEFDEACRKDPQTMAIMRYAPDLEENPRQTGMHAAGVLIGEQPLINFIPLTRDKDGNVISQWEAAPLERSGLLKMDFLGLKTLTVIREACDNVKATRGIDIDLDALPLDDKQTYEMLARGETGAVFQIESEGMRKLIMDLQIDRVEDLIAMIALYRPGPMQFIPSFTARKLGREPIDYPHPLLEPILKETYGIMIYQEQIQMAARVLAGFSLGQGDVLRRAMGKKDPVTMQKQSDAFVKGCVAKGTCSEKEALKIFATIQQFASYGFNKSHSAAYGIVTFQTAYLKAHYPVEFMAAMISSEMGNSDKLPHLISIARDMGIAVRPPDVNVSGLRFTPVPEDHSIRFGLAGIKGVGAAAAAAIIRERAENGPFKGFVDFCERMDSNRKVIETLVLAGAFDFTGIPRGRLRENIESVMAHAADHRKDAANGQRSLFDMFGGSTPGIAGLTMTDADLPDFPPLSTLEMLEAEKELLGFYISGHPLEDFRWTLRHYSQKTPEEFAALSDKTPVRIGGLATGIRRVNTKPKDKNDPVKQMLFCSLEMDGGAVPVAVYPAAYDSCKGILQTENKPVILCGQVRPDRNGEGNIIAVEEAYPLAEAPALFTDAFTLEFDLAKWSEDAAAAVADLLRAHHGRVPVTLCLDAGGTKLYFKTGAEFAIDPSEKLVRECTALGAKIRVKPRERPGLLRESPKPNWKRRDDA